MITTGPTTSSDPSILTGLETLDRHGVDIPAGAYVTTDGTNVTLYSANPDDGGTPLSVSFTLGSGDGFSAPEAVGFALRAAGKSRADGSTTVVVDGDDFHVCLLDDDGTIIDQKWVARGNGKPSARSGK